MKKKVIMITIAGISALLFIQKATSFSQGVVNSSVSINVTDHENALISVYPGEELIVLPGTVNQFYVNISNRVGYPIELKGATVEIDGLTFTYDTAAIGRGETYLLKVTLEASRELTSQSQLSTYQIPLQFTWEIGEATIPLEVEPTIQEEEVIEDEEEKEE